MSTKAIREALEAFRREATFPESPRARKAAEAFAELEAIERAARALVAEWAGHPPLSTAHAHGVIEQIAKETP